MKLLNNKTKIFAVLVPVLGMALMSPAYAQSNADAGASIFVLICSALFGLIFLGLWIWLCVWIYKDAQKRGIENGALWAILTFMFGLIPLLIYLFAIRNKGGNPPAQG
ncbi:MAG: hypothetical protein ACOCXT_02810 [Candidatus Dojkabacteria bacterium]